MEIMTIRATDEMRDKLMTFSKKRGVTRNALVISILHDWIRQREKEEQDGRESGK